MAGWVSLITALGIGAVIAALIARGVAIAQLRQAWLNSLRDDLAEVFATSDRISLIVRDGERGDQAENLSDLSHRSQAAFRKVLTRLNLSEPLHADLKEKLDALTKVGDRDDYLSRIDDAVSAAQRLLKAEWEVTKYGPFKWLFSRADYFHVPSPQ